MNIAFDPTGWTAIPVEHGAQERGTRPEWHVLRARLRAACEARSALGLAGREEGSRAFGSFSRRAAVSIERLGVSCPGVNQTSSVNRKRGGYILPEVAGMSSTGGRGLQ